MNQQSALQQQYPLSSKKFLKKMIQKTLAFVIIGFVMSIFWGILIWNATTDPASSSGPIATIMWGILIVGWVLIIIGVSAYSIYIRAYIRRYYYAGEDHFITIKKGVFAPAEIHVQWQKIQDVYVDQDILDRIMGLYDVHIASATAASGIEAHIDGVDQTSAEGLKQFLLGKVSGAGMNMQNQSMPQNISGAQTTATSEQAPTVNLSEEISSNRYPLTDTWFTIRLVGRIGSGLFFWAILVFGFTLKIVGTGATNWGTVILIYLGVAVVSVIFQVGSLVLWKKNYAFNFTPENIYYREGVISLSEKHMPYSSIQDVSVQQSVLERFVGLAKVRIENAAQGMVVPTRNGNVTVFNGVMIQGIKLADANHITDILKTTVLGRNTSRYGL